MVTERNSSGRALAAANEEGAGDAPGMAAMPPAPDSVLFAALWRAFVTQKELNAAMRAHIAVLEARVAWYDAAAESPEPAPPPRTLN